MHVHTHTHTHTYTHAHTHWGKSLTHTHNTQYVWRSQWYTMFNQEHTSVCIEAITQCVYITRFGGHQMTPDMCTYLIHTYNTPDKGQHTAIHVLTYRTTQSPILSQPTVAITGQDHPHSLTLQPLSPIPLPPHPWLSEVEHTQLSQQSCTGSQQAMSSTSSQGPCAARYACGTDKGMWVLVYSQATQ